MIHSLSLIMLKQQTYHKYELYPWNADSNGGENLHHLEVCLVGDGDRG